MLQIPYSVFWIVFQTFQNLLAFPWSFVLLVGLLPVVSAAPNDDPFSGITFKAFSEFVEQHFSSKISLTTVLVVLFTMTNNPDLLNLHARQQHPLPDEHLQNISGWLKALAHALDGKLGQDTDRLFQTTNNFSNLENDQRDSAIATKLDLLYKLLDLSAYDDEGVFHQRRYKQVKKEIEPAYVISPASMQCQTQSCKGWSLYMNTRDRDIPRATLIKGTKIYEEVHVLSGKCPLCKTIYYADHETSAPIDKNSGDDNGTKVYLNNAKHLKVGQSVWVDYVFSAGVINGIYHFHVSSSAFAEFLEDKFGILLRSLHSPTYSTPVRAKCTQSPRPFWLAVHASLSILYSNTQTPLGLSRTKLKNARGGVFCARHEITHDNLCCMCDCDRQKVAPSHTCAIHQNRWRQHIIRHGQQSLLVIHQLIRHSEEEHVEWLPQKTQQLQPHDEDKIPERKKDNYFVPPRFYCVETLCAPCGAVHAWTLFDKSESPTQILEFLDAVYPTPDVRPDYICIDKGCKILHTTIVNRSWNVRKETSRFIVDSYHYINHHTNDYLCHKWCNPAPLNGSAPNLVVVEHDVNGNAHYKRAFNTQACEQLNAWLGGFETILKRMTVYNFKWFLHAMLYIHTQQVMNKQRLRDNKEGDQDEEGIDIEGEEE
ncbi:hypothetical protein PILCRDRAFT_63011 [Piloderma croceum F 1598]|uniref:CxC5 like cysteine cluster associated with KDZ domain-containing protein n=1 Tax=Piloderma croceum (strain F 1598) TaxID=765440 RepID=A0A0C3CE27_PILCF|nr:hypothetical protein PILCRDRAFT_63011 [Piloderma croceum F 1598]